MKLLPETGLSFDDILLVPRYSDIESRFNGEIDLSSEILPGIKLKYPVISANMDSITEIHMARAMKELGCLGIIHRFLPHHSHLDYLEQIKGERVICIGVGEREFLRYKYIIEESEEKDDFLVLIDVAHGHCKGVIDQIKRIREHNKYIPIIAGNVATAEGAKDLWMAGADCVKIGCGPGSLCSTRINTGHGVPQLTAIIEADKIRKNTVDKFQKPLWYIIADGGIRNGGDCIKALACGADAVMIGGLLSGCEECPGEKIKREDGIICKRYRGMASRHFQEEVKGGTTSIEGEDKLVPCKGSVKPIIEELINNIKSGMSYQGARNLKELRENAVFIKQTTAGYKESIPHGLYQ